MPEVVINGPEGRLEGRYYHAKTPDAPIALILHPHPQQGGTMNNRIVHTLHQCFQRQGFSTLRFNFRGVGRSQGTFDRGEGELSDAASALDWMQSVNPNARACWVGGFAFGAWIGMQLLMRRPEIQSFISVAPPANQLDFTFLAPCPSSGLFVQGAKDDVVPPDTVKKLVTKLSQQRGIVIQYDGVPDANHFFHHHHDALIRSVEGYLERHVKKPVPEVAE